MVFAVVNYAPNFKNYVLTRQYFENKQPEWNNYRHTLACAWAGKKGRG